MRPVNSKEEFQSFAERLAGEHRLFHPDDAAEVVFEMFSREEQPVVFANLQWAYDNGLDPCDVFLRVLNRVNNEVRAGELMCPECELPVSSSFVQGDADCLSFEASCAGCGRNWVGTLDRLEE